MIHIERPLVTIVTITFNLINSGRKEFFLQCLESVHKQTYTNIEHIIVDGASTDGTIDLIKQYANMGWITYISEPDSGIYNAMNKGIKLAGGKYLAFLHSDDFYHNHSSVRLSIESLERQKADFSYANFIVTGDSERYISKGEIDQFIYTMPFGHPTMFVKTSVIRSETGFDEAFTMAADYDLIIRLILKDYKSVYNNFEMATYRLGGLGCTTEHSDEIAMIYTKNYSVFFAFSDLEQAKNIMYELNVPANFPKQFKRFAFKNRIRNIDIDKIVLDLENKVTKCEKSSRLNDIFKITGFKRKPSFLFPKNNNHNEIQQQTIDKASNIPIFLSSDDNYAPYVATTICSVMNHTDSFIDFYILDGGISDSNIKEIVKIKRKYPRFSVEFVKIDTKTQFHEFPTRLHFTIDMYNRFLIPELKPELDKVIYSDVDVIFNGDVAELYNEDLNGFAIGAVPYTFGYLNPNKDEILSFHKRLNLSETHKYFESGLLVLDCQQWRENDITNKLLEKVKECGAEVILTPDQDTLNIVFENNYQELDNKYIVVPHRKVFMMADEQAKISVINPFIYHFAGSNKPWTNPSMEYADVFWNYARETSFYKRLICNLIKHKFYRIWNISSHEVDLPETNRAVSNLVDKIFPAVFSPKRFITKHAHIIPNSKFRQVVRKVYYTLASKKFN